MSEGNKPKLEIYLIASFNPLYSSAAEVSVPTLHRIASTQVITKIEVVPNMEENYINRVFSFIDWNESMLLACGETFPYFIDKKTRKDQAVYKDRECK